ncbi:hypothetical protein VYU27_010736, partial [Nannochloropsis oceanica]
MPDLVCFTAFISHDLPCAFLDLGEDAGEQQQRGTVVDPWTHFNDEMDRAYLNEQEPMLGVFSLLRERYGPERLSILAKLIATEGYGKPLRWFLDHRADLKSLFKTWELNASRSMGYNVDDLLPENWLLSPAIARSGVPPK